MNDNVIKFRKPEKPKPPRQTPPWLRSALIWGGVILAFVLVYFYFRLTGQTGAP